MESKKKNYPQINVIKAIASFSVTAVHFRNRIETGIPEAIVNNKIILFFSTNYALFIFAVPLFLLATGFLSIHKKNDIKNILNVIKIYSLYLFMAFISYGMMVTTGTREFIGWRKMITSALSFSLISGWYIELFVGLALLIPFLNLLINNISKKEFQLLIITLIFVVSLPAFINANPVFHSFSLPNYWESIYPIIYYFIGAYIRLYYREINIQNRTLLFLYSASTLYIIQLLYKYSSPYTKAFEGYYASIINIVLATSFFLLIFRKINKSNVILDIIAKYTLSTYIMAYPIDKILYPKFSNYLTPVKNMIISSPLIVIISFTVSLISGIILYKAFNYLWIYLIEKLDYT